MAIEREVPPHCIAAETRRCDCGFEAPTGEETCPVYGLPAYVCLISCDMNRLAREEIETHVD